MTDGKNIQGHYYPVFHPGWGGFAEELFHYTSRYYNATEAFLRNLVGDRAFSMSGYKAEDLSEPQREVLAAILAEGPDRERGNAVVAIVGAVRANDAAVPAGLAERFPPLAAEALSTGPAGGHRHEQPAVSDAGPLDPFLNLAERLQMPVAIHDRHVEVSLHHLAEHLDSGNTTLRDNLQDAVVALHRAGFVMRNHPDLTHAEARSLSDDDWQASQYPPSLRSETRS